MPRVHHRKAAKDYPNHGIAKGDMYYTWKIRSAYGGTVYRSKTYPKPWQLTNSEYRQGCLIAEDNVSTANDPDDFEEIAGNIRELGEGCQERFENMPEGLQQGDTGILLEERASACETVADELENLTMEFEREYDDSEDFNPDPVDEDSEDDDELNREPHEEWQDREDGGIWTESEDEYMDRLREEASSILDQLEVG